MNQTQRQQICQLAAKSGLFNDMEAYKATFELSEAQAKILNPLSPNIELLFVANAAQRSAEMTEELLLLGVEEDDDEPESEQE